MSALRIAAGESPWSVDWRRVSKRTAIGSIVVIATLWLFLDAAAGRYGLDFRDGIWRAGSAVLHGRSPYPPANAKLLFSLQHAFVTPPPLAVLGAPFALLPFGPAVVVWDIICVGAFAGALAVLGVRDVRIYALALSSFLLYDSLTNGQPDGLFVLAAALAWRCRDSWAGGVGVGVLIAAKLVAAPLLLWFLVTRRMRSFAIACASTAILLAASWAFIGFKGLAGYPKLLAADAHAFETWSYSYSVVKALNWLGVSENASRWLSLLVAAAVAMIVVRRARGSDFGWFTAMLTFGLLASPILWLHYLLLLYVPMAISRRNSLAIWLVAAYAFWMVFFFLPDGVRAIGGVAIASTLAIWLVGGSRAETAGLHFRRVQLRSSSRASFESQA
jgi:hypothetical protein